LNNFLEIFLILLKVYLQKFKYLNNSWCVLCEYLNMCDLLFCTINDFPIYNNLPQYSIKRTILYVKNTHVTINWKMEERSFILGIKNFVRYYHPYCRLRKAFNGENSVTTKWCRMVIHQMSWGLYQWKISN
jgi:hypothetical protein